MESVEQEDAPAEIDFATYVAIEAALSEGGGPVALLLADEGFGPGAEYSAASETFGQMRAKSAEVENGFQRMKAYFAEEYRAGKKKREAEERAREAERRAAEQARKAAPLREFVEEEPPAPEPERPRAKLQGTALALDVPRGPALPFAPAAAVESTPEPPPSPAEPAEPRPALTGTALALDIPKVLPLPFSATAAVKRAPEKLAGTLPLGGGPLPLPPMPFRTGDSPAPPLASLPAPSLPARPAHKLGGTSLAVEVPKTPATPFQATKDVTPRTTLEQHASLCAELAFYTGHEEAVLQRYGVDAAGKSALDDHYRSVVQASPEARLAWNRSYQAYSTWLAKHR